MVLAYLSAPIIHSKYRKDDFCTAVLEFLEQNGVNVFAPQLLGPAEARVVFNRDVKQVRMSDFLIAEVSSPSHGVGMEIMLAIELIKPVLLFFNTDSFPLSKMIAGAEGKALFEYDSIDKVIEILSSINLHNLIVQRCPKCPSHVAEVLDDSIRCVVCHHSDRDIVV